MKTMFIGVIIVAIIALVALVAVVFINQLAVIENQEKRLSADQTKLSEYNRDMALAEFYEIEYFAINEAICNEPLPESFREMRDEVQYLQDKETELLELRAGMQLLQQKYPDNPNLVLEYSCQNDAFVKLKEAVDCINDENCEFTPTEYEQKLTDWEYTTLYEKLDECVVNFNEKYGFVTCIDRLKNNIDFMCQKYSDNCFTETNQELMDWLEVRYPDGVN